MATITDFQEWIEQSDLDSEGYTAVYSLYRAVKGCTSMGGFECKKSDHSEQWFVTADSSQDTLRLASEDAREYFLAYLTKTYCGELDMEGWYSFNHAMSKDD